MKICPSSSWLWLINPSFLLCLVFVWKQRNIIHGHCTYHTTAVAEHQCISLRRHMHWAAVSLCAYVLCLQPELRQRSLFNGWFHRQLSLGSVSFEASVVYNVYSPFNEAVFTHGYCSIMTLIEVLEGCVRTLPCLFSNVWPRSSHNLITNLSNNYSTVLKVRGVMLTFRVCGLIPNRHTAQHAFNNIQVNTPP